MVFDFNEWYSGKINGNTLFSYKGGLTSEKITRILEEIEKNALVSDTSCKLKRKIYNVLVESLQNMFHHGETMKKDFEVFCDDKEHDEASKFCVILFQKESIGYLLRTANFIRQHNMKLVKDKIDQVNVLSHEEIKALYKLILNNHEFSDRGGGGLGLIDIAKRTESRLSYEFHEFQENLFLYSLEVNVY